MKFRLKAKSLIVVMLLIVVVCLVLTGLIVGSLGKETSASAEKYWFFRESIKTGEILTLKNAYLLSNEGGQLVFIHEGETYTVEGTLEMDAQGIVDIEVYSDKITKIYNKPYSVEGVLESYTDDTLCLMNLDGKLQEIDRNDDIPVYSVTNGQIAQRDWNNFIVGVSKIDCVMENGKICAILIKEDVLPESIRVVIKNGSGIFHNQLYIKNISDDTLIHVTESMNIAGEKGLCLCNSEGTPLKDAYEGAFKIIDTENGFVLINELPLETYLKYVVPSEMPLSFGKEALKAQAVCARTYAYAQMYNQTYAKYGANLDDSTSFQVYHNTKRYDLTDEAVEETKGEVITQNGQLVNTLYFSTHPTDANSPFSAWNAYIDMSHVEDETLGSLKNVKVLDRNKDGFATRIELHFANGTKEIENEYTIRKEIGKYLSEIVLKNESVRTDLTILPSSYFEVKNTQDGVLVLKGAGYGHGIGMSQYGAKAMSDAGYSYKEIIEHYYGDVFIKTQ